ncbi:hypothetical protein Tco_0512454 [Tanacetum coccineum]
MLPSSDDALRLKKICRTARYAIIRTTATLLLEDVINLLTVIKGKTKYRWSWKHDFVKDYLPARMSEFKSAL